MLELFTSSKTDAIVIIKGDHDKVKELFIQFDKADNLRTKKKIVAQAIMELKIHAEIEEKIFYPSIRKDMEKDLMHEADEEHHVAKLIIAELEQMDGSEDHWEAKFVVLAENIRHHIKEEEGEMLPKARRLRVDFDAVGRKLLALKERLKKNGVPVFDEEKLMARSRAKADSPAKAAKAKPTLKIIKSRKKAKPHTARSRAHAAKSVLRGRKTEVAKVKRRVGKK